MPPYSISSPGAENRGVLLLSALSNFKDSWRPFELNNRKIWDNCMFDSKLCCYLTDTRESDNECHRYFRAALPLASLTAQSIVDYRLACIN